MSRVLLQNAMDHVLLQDSSGVILLQGDGVSMTFYLPYELTSSLILTGNTDPFNIDPDLTSVITSMAAGTISTTYAVRLLEGGGKRLLELDSSVRDLEQTQVTSTLDPFDIEPDLTSLITAANTEAFGIEPDLTLLITSGL